VRVVRNAVRWREFAADGPSDRNLFWGVYRDFAEALSAAPSRKQIGYDNEESANLYRWKFDLMEPSDYAVLYWLEHAIKPGAKVFDFGGHVGIKYYSFRSIGALQAPLTWIVYDVPAVLRSGQALARERGETNLAFTNDVGDASGADVFMALGASQYVEAPISSYLEPLARRPKVVIISKAPMVEGDRYVTLQNMGTAYCPYLIEDSRALIADMERLGYRLRHRWANDEKSCVIMNHPERSLYAYTSLRFTLD
jgi:putative methyltransferase (TIGR04325 family)